MVTGIRDVTFQVLKNMKTNENIYGKLEIVLQACFRIISDYDLLDNEALHKIRCKFLNKVDSALIVADLGR